MYGVESADALRQAFKEKNGTFEASYAETIDLAEKWSSEIRTYEEDLKEDSGYIAQQRKDAITAAEKKLQTELGGITTGWTNEQIDSFAKLAEQSGFKMDSGFINMLKSINSFNDDSKKVFTEAGEFIPEKFDEAFGNVIPIITSNAKEISGESKGIGEGVAEGVATGIKNRQYKAVNAAVDMVKKAIAAAKAAGDIHSPSRKTRDLIGKPFAEGIGVGIEGGMKDVVKKVQVGIGKITTGGSTAVTKNLKQNNSTGNKGLIAAIQGLTSGKSVVQNNNFTTKTLTPYEQQVQIKRLNRDLMGVV